MSVLSVDLGTSNTVAVLAAHGRVRVVEVDGSPVLPSAVFATTDGQLVVGREAERRARLDPARYEPNPKRRIDDGTLLLGDRVVPVTEAFAAVLRQVVDEVSRQLGGRWPDEVRLTHPAQWGPLRRNALLSAARQIGLGTRPVLVPEPVAAAAHFASFPGRSPAPGQALAVYDLGAGTFDVAVVSGSVVLAESGLPDLGGLDVDQALLAYVGRQVSGRDPQGWQRLLMPMSTADRRAQRAFREDIRAAKESLSNHPQTEVPLPDPFGDVLLTRAELESLIRANLSRSVELLAATVRSAGLSPDRLAGVYLVGGSSRIPLVATLIAERLGILPTNLDQPETAVALGAHHVSPAGTSLRTENLPGRPAMAEQWRPTGMTPPVVDKPRKRQRWLILIPVTLALLLAVGWGVRSLVETSSANEDAGPTDTGPTVTNALDVPDKVDCARVIPLDKVSSVVGSTAVMMEPQQVQGSEFPHLCYWVTEDDRIRVYLRKNVWYPQDKEFTLKSNPAYQTIESSGSLCTLAVAVGSGTELELIVSNGDDPCGVARTLLETAFDHFSGS